LFSEQMPKQPINPSKGIAVLFAFWLLGILAAIGCYLLISPTGESNASYGLNRAIPITSLTGIASISALISALKTRFHRKLLKKRVKSLGYSPIIATAGGLATIVHWIINGS